MGAALHSVDRHALQSAAAAQPAPDVSVIVSVFNKDAELAACLDSVLAQTLRNIEVVCVDDASTDGSPDILARYAARDSRVRVIRVPHNRGPGPTRNLGISLAYAPYVQFTDADDLLPERALEVLYRRAEKDCVPVVRGTMAGFHTADPQRQELLHEVGDRSNFAPFYERELWTPWWHPCYLFSRALLLNNGIGYPRLRSGEDPVFLASVLVAAPRMSTIAEITYRYRIAELETKDRARLDGLRAFIHHARIVKDILGRAQPESWTLAYGPRLQRDIERQIRRFPLSETERANARAETDLLFSDADAAPCKMLFVYRVCGLGGVETSILNKLEALRRLGINAEVLFLRHWGDGGRMISDRRGVHVASERPSQVRILRQVWDAVIVVDTPEFSEVLEEARLDCPIVFETHASFAPALSNYHGRAVDPMFAAVVAPSEFNKRLLLSAGCTEEKIHVIPNGIDHGVFAQKEGAALPCSTAELPSDVPLVLSIGRLEPQKNTLEFVRIACGLLDEGRTAHFVVVGDAVDTSDYAASVRNAVPPHYRGHFSFIARVDYSGMPQLYLQSARSGGCLVVTALNESQPMTIIEAMACRCPIVATRVGGIDEMVFDSLTGRLYSPGDVESAVAAVRQWLQDGNERERIAEHASAFVKLEHSSTRTAELYMALVKKLKSNRRNADPPQDGNGAAKLPSATEATASNALQREFAVRLDALVGQFVALHMDALRDRIGTGKKALAALFSQPLLAPTEAPAKAYSDIVPGVQIGCEPMGAATLALRPREDFSHSPAHCLNTVTLRFSGKSRWFTLELALDWEELRAAERYQIGLYVRADRPAPGHVVLRLPQTEGRAIDHRLADFHLAPGERSCHCSGALALPNLPDRDPKRRPKLIFFFDPHSDLTLKFDYLTAYFA